MSVINFEAAVLFIAGGILVGMVVAEIEHRIVVWCIRRRIRATVNKSLRSTEIR